MTRMTPALARLLVAQQEDKERPDERDPRKQRKQTRSQVKVPQQRTGVRLPPR